MPKNPPKDADETTDRRTDAEHQFPDGWDDHDEAQREAAVSNRGARGKEIFTDDDHRTVDGGRPADSDE